MNTQLHGDEFPETRRVGVWGKDLVAGQRSWRRDFMVKEEIGTLVRERGLAKVQKQRKQRKNNKRRLPGERRNCIFCLSLKKS